MLNISLFFQGVGIGILFSAPIGPVNIMCIQLAFRRGFFAGLSAGLGAVVADGLFAAMAAYGMTAISDVIQGHATAFQLVGAALLIAFGIRIYRSQPHLETDPADRRTIVSTALASFGMTITNPATILGFFAVFGSLGDMAPVAGDYLGATLLLAGVLAGGAGWWFFVASLVATLRDRMTDTALGRINRIAGAVLILFAIAILARLGSLWLGRR